MSSANPRSAPFRSMVWKLGDDLGTAFKQAATEWDSAGKTERLWARDPTLWTNRDEASCLGWLDVAAQQLADISKFKALAAEVHEDGFEHILLLGTGEASLCAEAFGHISGRQAGWPELLTLDTTDPAEIRSVRSKIDPAHTLFCVSSQSTDASLEPKALLQYFLAEAKEALASDPAHHFLAITDPGSALEKCAHEWKFRRVYRFAPGTCTGYSALSDAGLVPHAAAGLDTEKLLRQTLLMAEACRSTRAPENPGVALGLILGTAALQFGRDKVTLLCSSSLRTFGPWVGQLLAGSTGKDGKGLIPIEGEPLAGPQSYGNDRLFVRIRSADDGGDDPEEAAVAELEASGQPVLRLQIDDAEDLGAAFLQWEIAAATACSLLGVNPFEQPNVRASDEATGRLLEEYKASGLAPAQAVHRRDSLGLHTDKVSARGSLKENHLAGAIIRRHLDRLTSGDYLALLAYIPRSRENEEVLEDMRKHVLEAKQVATAVAFGPRFLHTTGQAYKGGPNTGVFLQITCDESADVALPADPLTFGAIKMAQADGDFAVLEQLQRRILRIHLGADIEGDMSRLHDLVCAAVAH